MYNLCEIEAQPVRVMRASGQHVQHRDLMSFASEDASGAEPVQMLGMQPAIQHMHL